MRGGGTNSGHEFNVGEPIVIDDDFVLIDGGGSPARGIGGGGGITVGDTKLRVNVRV